MSKVKWQLGHVRWFNELAGEGIVRTDEGQCFYVHYSAIESKDKFKTLKRDQKVKLQVSADPYINQVLKIKER